MGRNTREGTDQVAAALSILQQARTARRQAEEAEIQAVEQARSAGASWGRIGQVYGLTKQGAQQRFKQLRRQDSPDGGPDGGADRG